MWAALDVRRAGDADLLLLALDDFQPTAIEERDPSGAEVRVFFAGARHRDAALAGLPSEFRARAVEVSDEDWVRRSQLHLAPVTVGAITLFPTLESLRAAVASPGALLIPPSMGFGTGHHASTRLCLAALQAIDLSNRLVIDVGTGSGVLALAARLLGARAAIGIDYDADAIQSAEENLAGNRVLNSAIDHVAFHVGDLRSAALTPADVVTANLTGAVLTRWAGELLRLLSAGGTLIVSGIQADERSQVFPAFGATRLVWEAHEDGWIGAAFMLEAPAEARGPCRT